MKKNLFFLAGGFLQDGFFVYFYTLFWGAGREREEETQARARGLFLLLLPF